MAGKYSVPDSNIILTNANYVFNELAGKDDFLVIPAFLYEEVDNLKDRCGTMEDFNIREFFRNIKILSASGNLATGVKNSNGATVMIVPSDKIQKPESAFYNDWFPEKKVDNKILLFVQHFVVKNNLENKNVVCVTFDNGIVGKTNCLGITTYEPGDIREKAKEAFIATIYKGYRHINISSELAEIIKSKLFLAGNMLPDEIKDLSENEFLVVNNNYNLTCRYFKGNVVVRHHSNKVFSMEPAKNNLQQKFAWDLLSDKNIRIVTQVGEFGAGKTVLALLLGIAQTKGFPENHYEKLYDGIMVVTPTRHGKHHVGDVPGTKSEKLQEWMGCILDNIEAIKMNGANISMKDCSKLITFENLEHLGGRSLHYKYIMIEEAHNLSKDELKRILTRGAKGTKIIINGDPFQCRFSNNSSGLLHAIEVLKKYPETGSIFLEKIERDRIAEIISEAW